MCLAVPGKVIQVDGKAGKVDFLGVQRQVQLDLVPEAVAGDWVLVHAGFAIHRIDEEEARETLALLRKLEAETEGGG
ncbi:MAG TPA: HypC/HybG/HupF family hydrogenase formation chaperone [Polyangiaceae bacterium]|nr:HypC/HybG/HupF family hydrogenase formation chaperone [Polyangiaceae bacterium]